MSPKHKHPANQRLTWERLERGWSHDELAKQVIASMAEHDDDETGLTGNTVRRWETGERWPDPRYRKHLVLVLGRSASELGLLTPDELVLRPEDAQRRLNTVAAHIGTFDRKVFLTGLVSAGLLSLDAQAGAAERVERLTYEGAATVRTANAHAEITTQLREMYWAAPAATLMESALSHVRLGIEMLTYAGGTVGEQVASSLAEAALLTARLAFFDLSETKLAERCFDVASNASEQARDHAIAAAVYGHRAFVPGFAGDRAGARALLDTAHCHARYAPGPLLRSWLHCVSAEIEARNGEAQSSLAHVRQASESLSTQGHDPLWLDYFDKTRLDGFAGNALLLAGRNQEATTVLQRATNDLALSDKQRPVMLLDLASAVAPDDPEHAHEAASRAIDSLQTHHYATAFDRIPAIRNALARTSYAGDLDERLQSLGTSH